MKTPTFIGLRPNQTDMLLIDELSEKLGIAYSSVIRLALHRLAEREGLKKQ